VLITSDVKFGFLPHDAIVYASIVCLSVTSQCTTEMAKHRIAQTTPHDSPGTLVSDAKDLGKVNRGHPNGGAKCRWGRLKLAIFNK